jgi:hypothetical protein
MHLLKRRPTVAFLVPTLLAGALLAAACTRPLPVPIEAQVAATQPSRAPYPNCQWQPFVSRTAGLGMLVQQCTPPLRVFSADESGVFATSTNAPAGGRSINPVGRIIEIYPKRPTQPITDAIAERFFPILPAQAQGRCEVQGGNRLRIAGPKEFYSLAPTAAYQADAQRQAGSDPGAQVCGDHGITNAVTYFEYHPTEDPSRYLFVRVGQDAPLFDEHSLRLFPPRP